MSQNDYSSIVDPASTSGNIINQTIDNWQSALHSNHSGSSLPFYAEEGMIWVQIVSSTQHILNYYNGTNSISLATINPVTLSVVFPNVVEKTSDTGSAKLPVGTTAEQPAAESGYARVNSSTNEALVAVGSNYFEITNDRKGVATTDVDAMVVAFLRPVLALTDKMTFQVRSFGENTVTNPTISIDGLPPVTIVKNGNQPLSAGDTGNSGNVMMLHYTTDNGGKVELLNPQGTSGGIFSSYYESSEQVITSAGFLSLTHGLKDSSNNNISPQLIQLSLICKTDDNGSVVGDEIVINPAGNDPGSGGSAVSRGISVSKTETDIKLRYGSDARVFGAVDYSDGSRSSFQNNSWRLVVRAWG